MKRVCYEQAERVKTVLILSGFVPNIYKCIWKPVQSLLWLGFTWDLKYCLLKLLTAKITNFIELIDIILPTASKVKIRLLAKLCGKIISFTPAIGNVTQIMTRCNFFVLNERDE